MSKKVTTSKSIEQKTEIHEPKEEKQIPRFSHSQLREALLYLEDCMDRCLMQWFLTGETARQAKNNTDLSGEEITGGVTIQTLNAGISILKSVVSDLQIYCSPEESKSLTDAKYLSFSFQGVPIRVQVIHNKYEVFNHLDFINYDVASFYIPNPFKEYVANKEIYE